MRILSTLLALLLCTTALQAQKKKKNKKEKEKIEETIVSDEPIVEEVVMEIQAEPIEETRVSQNLSDASGSFYISDTYSAKNLTVVYRNSPERVYALMKTSTQTLITPFIFENFYALFSQSDYATIRVNGLNGTINSKGESVIPCLYDNFSNFLIDEQVYFIASTPGGNYGVINESNEVLIPFDYSSLSQIYRMNNYLKAKKGNLFGIINPISKKEVIPFLYQELEPYNSTQIRVKKDNLYNYIDASGNPILSKWYTNLNINDEGLMIARYNNKDGVIDLTEKTIIPFEYDRIERTYSDAGAYQVQKNGKYGIITKEGTVVIPVQYDNLQSANTYYIVSSGSRKGIVDKSGKILLPLEYEEIERTDKNLLVRKNGKQNILDKDLKPAFTQQYDDLKQISLDGSYYTSHYLVSKGVKKGIIDLTGKPVVDVAYDNFIPSSSSSYRASYTQPITAVKGGKYGMVDLSNKVVIPFEYEYLMPLNSFLVIVGKKGKYGITEIYNPAAQVLPIEYSFIAYKQGKTLVAYKDKFISFKVNGSKIIPQN